MASTFALNTGRCITCRQELRKKRNPFCGDGHYDVPLTVENKVYKGRCLRCNPFPHTTVRGSVIQGKVSGDNKQSRRGSAVQDFNRRHEVDRHHHHARLSSSNQFSFNAPCYDRKQSSRAAPSTSKLSNVNHPHRRDPSNVNVLPITHSSVTCAVTIPLEVDIRKKHSGLKSFFHSILPSSLSREANVPIKTVYISSRQDPNDDDSLGMYSHTEDHNGIRRRRSA
jgi:hypothetical protein